MECAYAPFNWTQTTDANGAVPISGKDNLYASGYDVQVAKYIAAELGMALEVYSYEWDSPVSYTHLFLCSSYRNLRTPRPFAA